MTKMNDISNNLTTSLSELEVNTTKCFQELNSLMKQFVRETIDEYAAIKLNAHITKVVKKKVYMFLIEHFKFYMHAHLDELLENRDIAKATDLTTVEYNLEDTDKRHAALCRRISASAEPASHKEQEM